MQSTIRCFLEIKKKYLSDECRHTNVFVCVCVCLERVHGDSVSDSVLSCMSMTDG